MNKKNISPLFHLFWENSKLNDKNILNFVENFQNEESGVEKIVYPTVDLKLRLPKDKLFKIMAKRRSEREFHSFMLTEKILSSLFSCFAEVDNHRLLPSAGGKYPIEVYAMCFHVEGLLNEKTVYYNWLDHSLSIIGKCGKWRDIEKVTGNNGLVKGEPSMMFVFIGFPDRVTAKYGERGGRFLLIESGHYLQNLSLRIVFENLKAVELGGLFDDNIKKILGLEHTDAMVTLGIVCGK